MSVGQTFLRVSLFEHEATESLRKMPFNDLDGYYKDVQSLASCTFPSTFLDSEKIARKAGDNVLNRIRVEALAWIALIAIVFSAIQIVSPMATKWIEKTVAPTELQKLDNKVESLRDKLEELKNSPNYSSLKDQK